MSFFKKRSLLHPLSGKVFFVCRCERIRSFGVGHLGRQFYGWQTFLRSKLGIKVDRNWEGVIRSKLKMYIKADRNLNGPFESKMLVGLKMFDLNDSTRSSSSKFSMNNEITNWLSTRFAGTHGMFEIRVGSEFCENRLH